LERERRSPAQEVNSTRQVESTGLADARPRRCLRAGTWFRSRGPSPPQPREARGAYRV